MAQNILKAKGRRVAPKKAKTVERKIILVGTYREGQLAWIKKNRLYNYPVREGDKFGAALGKVSELWLYAGTKAKRHCYEAKFVRQMTRAEWLKENPTYGEKVKSKGQEEKVKVKGEGEQWNPLNPLNPLGTNKAYYVFEVKPLEYGTRFDAPEVITRVADFGGRSAKIKRAIEQYEKDGKFASLAAYLPTELSQVPKSQLRVCEPWVQMDFMNKVEPVTHEEFPFPAPQKGKFTFIDLFAGIGGIRLGFQQNGGKCVFSSEWDKDAAKTYYYNFGEHPFGDIQKIDPKTIPDFDVLLAGFPCQPFSIIGDKEGFNHETQGTLFFNIEKILLAKKPKAFMLENVRNLTAHDNGRTFKVIIAHLRKAGYDVHYKVLNALDYGVPQKRERIIICGFRKKVAFDFPPPIPAEERKTVADIIDDSADHDKSLFVRPAIRQSRIERLKDKKFPRPYISHENVAGSITPHTFSCALRAGASANYILINDERRPSAREMLRIQGFPDEFKVVVNYGQIKHQTGNSVAVPVIRAVAKRLVEKLKEL